MKGTNTSRQSILDRLRSRPLDAPSLPEVDATMLTQFENPVAKFSEMLEMVGGTAHQIDHPSQIEGILRSLPEYSSARQIASLVPDAVEGNVDASLIDDPHSLASLDWVIAPGQFMVAENGAIWVDGDKLPHRVMLFIAQYLAIVVSRDQIVHHMHQAYSRIGEPVPSFGVFVSGPSKTADIEQSLVLGAHGCRSLQVFLTDFA